MKKRYLSFLSFVLIGSLLTGEAACVRAVEDEFLYGPVEDEIILEEMADMSELYMETEEDESETFEEEHLPGEIAVEEVSVMETLAELVAVDIQEKPLNEAIVDYALQFVGKPYKPNGNSLIEGTDVGGFIQLVFGNFGMKLPRSPADQCKGPSDELIAQGYTQGIKINPRFCQPGDIIFNGGYPLLEPINEGDSGVELSAAFAGIYIGNGEIVYVAANYGPYPSGGIKVSDYEQLLGSSGIRCVRYWDIGKSTICTEHAVVTKPGKKPTCISAGTTARSYCNVCGMVISDERMLFKTGNHIWNTEYTVDQPATMTETGVKSIHCRVCNMVKVDSEEEIPKIVSHKFGKWKIIQEPTVDNASVEMQKCQDCGFEETRTGEVATPILRLNADKIVLKVKQKSSALKILEMAKGDKVASWRSSNENIFKVSSKGTITAGKKTGKATLTITLKSGFKKKITVYVRKDDVETTKLTGLKKKYTLKKGSRMTLQPVCYPITSQEKITYTSSDKAVATVSSKGVVRAKKAGTAKITVKSGTAKYTVTIAVPKTKTTKITGVKTKLSLKKGKSYRLKTKLYPSNSDEAITYTSSNKKVAEVDKNGKIKALKRGKSTITVKSGKVTVKCRVTVK